VRLIAKQPVVFRCARHGAFHGEVNVLSTVGSAGMFKRRFRTVPAQNPYIPSESVLTPAVNQCWRRSL